VLVFAAVIPPLKAHLAAAHIEDAVVGYGDAVRVAAEIIERLAGSAERLLCIDHPLGFFDRREIPVESVRIGKRWEIAEELKPVAPEGLTEFLKKQPPKEAGERAHREKESPAAADPFEIGTDAATGNDEVHMRVMQKILSPGVQNAEEADLGAEMPGIAREGEQGFSGGLKQNAVNHALVVKGDARDLRRQSEDHVEVFDR